MSRDIKAAKVRKTKSLSTAGTPTADSPQPEIGRKRKDTSAGKKVPADRQGKYSVAKLDRLTKKELRDLVLEQYGERELLQRENDKLRQVSASLENLQHRYIDLYDFAPVGYFTLDGNGLIQTANMTGATMLSADRDLLFGRHFKSFVRQEDQDIFDLHVQNILLGDRPGRCELRMAGKAGSFFYARLECRAVRDENGKFLEIRTTVSDITEHKLLEVKYHRKSAILRAIIDATDVMLVYLDLDFNFVWVNPAYAENCQMKPEEMAGRNHFELYPHPENEAIFRRVRETGRPVFFKDKPFAFADQPERGVTYWDWSLTPHKNEADQVIGLVFSLRETTKYKQAEMECVRSEERFRRIAEASADIIFQMDLDGILTYCSPAVQSFGYNLNQVIGHPFSEFVLEAELPRAMEALEKINSGESIKLFDISLLKSDGTAVDCEISATPLIIQGNVVGQQGIARDISERSRSERALRESQAQLQIVFNHMTEGLIIADLEGRLIQWNPAALATHGFASGEEYLRRISDFTEIFELATEEGVLPLEQWPMMRILRGETISNWEVNIRRLDIDWQRTISYGGSLARDSDERPVLAVLTLVDVTERKKADENIRRNNALLKGIKSIFEAGLHCKSDGELADVALRVCEKLTGSEFGFIGEIGPDGLLHDIVMSNPGWEQCAMPGKEGHGKLPGGFRIAGLYGQVLEKGRSLLTNNPISHPDSIGTPPGHPALQAFMGVPLQYGGTTIGMIALGNRPGGYREAEIASIETLAPAFVETLFKNRVERALKESEARAQSSAKQFKDFLDFTPIPVLIAHDPECRVITGNLAAARLFGVETDQNISQTPPLDVDTPRIRFYREGRELALSELPLQYVVANGTGMDEVEIDIVPPNGRSLNMLGAATALFDDKGQVRGGIAAYMDISDRRWMEEQLLQAKQEWEQTFDSVPDLIAILDSEHRIIRANRAMADRMGISPGQSISRKCFTCVHGKNKPPDNCPHTLTMLDGREHVSEVYEENLGGYFLVSTTPLFNEDGEVFATVHVARDITERKIAEEQLLESEGRFKRAEKIAHLGSWEIGLDDNTINWSDEVYRIFGLAPQQFSPSYESFLEMIHPEDRQKVHNAYTRSLNSGSDSYEIEHRIIHRTTGETRYVHEKCEHLRDEHGNVISSVGMVHDITERKLAEEQIRLLNLELQSSISKLEDINRELARSNRDLQQFVNIASHDLQEPLRTISSFMQLLRRRYSGKLDDKADTFIDFAVEGAGRMQELINDLLTFSRVGGGEMRVRPVVLQHVLQGLQSTLKTTIEENQVEIIVEKVPVVRADETQIKHLLQNLIINAIKFRSDAPPRIHIFAEQKNNETVVCVRDNGIGIDPQHAERIFMIFQRLHSKEEYSGTGIGLAICKKIVERHGGRIWVESTPGEGSLFCFSLPE